MRRTKIVCTLGPSTDNEEVLRQLMLEGMAVARMNFSHGTHEEQKVRLDAVKKLRDELGLPIAAFSTAMVEIFTFCVRKLPRSFLTVSLYLFTAAGVFCGGLELLIRRYGERPLHLSWSAVVLTVCAILDIAVITMLSRRRLRDAVRRRLHF